MCGQAWIGIEDAVRLLEDMERTESFGAAVEPAFPWIEWFTEAGRENCIDDHYRKLRTAASVGRRRGFGLAVGSWRGTAEALADGMDRDEDLGMYDAGDMPPAPRPEWEAGEGADGSGSAGHHPRQ